MLQVATGLGPRPYGSAPAIPKWWVHSYTVESGPSSEECPEKVSWAVPLHSLDQSPQTLVSTPLPPKECQGPAEKPREGAVFTSQHPLHLQGATVLLPGQ